jgi:virginiamycin B lyase
MIRAPVGANLAGALCLVAVLCALAVPASAGAFVYWANYTGDTIGRANLDGTGANPSFITSADNLRGVAVDGQHVYWDNYNTGAIGRSSLDGSLADQGFITGADFPVGVAVDGQHVYWANSSSNTNAIGRANLDGTGSPEQTFIPGASGPEGVAVDGQHIYWANYTSGKIGRANLDGNSVDQSFITGADHPEGVAVDAQHVYWANSTGATIGRADLDGNNVDQSFITGVAPTGVAVDAQHVYWANAGTGIARANLDGSSPDLSFIPSTDGNPVDVAVDSLAGTSPAIYRALTVAKAGLGAGSVTSTDSGINCGSSCSHSYPAGTVVTLQASAAAGSTFAGWSGPDCSGTGSCTVTMSSDETATATFKRRPSRPNTSIGKARIDSTRSKATFRFKASGRSTGFQCALVKKGHKAKFKRCKSPTTYKRLKRGKYTFEVRAVGPAGTDRSPAKKKFKLG